MALVRWCGFDPETGEPWQDSWVPRGNLTKDLRAGRHSTASGAREESAGGHRFTQGSGSRLGWRVSAGEGW